ncbi:hypothetical protein FACS189452_09680 [Bacteroidia bacterium]|nr:hypothetical protein FACS189452_09680 [Bacteroidia bacterium]
MRKQILDYVIITLGLLTFTTAWVAFLIPHEIVGGGVVGASALISYVTKGLIPLEYPYFILNIILFVVGVRVLGRQFGAKTLFSIIVSSLLFRYLPLLIPQEFIEQVRREPNLLLWALVGGMLEGAGIGIAFTRGGNSGGTDIIALIVNKYKHIAANCALPPICGSLQSDIPKNSTHLTIHSTPIGVRYQRDTTHILTANKP